MEKDLNIKLSVIETEQKYYFDTTETTYGGGDAIVSWGVDNNIPTLLTNCYEGSATLKATIDMSVNYVIGDNVSVSDDAKIFQDKVNRRGQTMKDLIEHLAADFWTYGNFCFQVIFNKMGNPVELYPIDVTKCRLNENGTKVFYSKKKWTKYQTKSETFGRYGRVKFDPEHPTMMFFYNGTGIRRTYNKAPWSSALDDVLTEIESSKYALNAVSNGFAAKYLLTFPEQNLTNEQKQAVEDGIKTKFSGPDAKSDIMLYWGDSNSIKVDKIEADNSPERWAEVKKTSRENIFTAMRMSPLLCGLAAENTGFSTQEFSDSFKLYERTVARPARETIVKCVEDVIGRNTISVVPFSITFDNAE